MQILSTLTDIIEHGHEKVSNGAKIRSRYNQVPHLTQDTNGKVTNSQLDTTNESQEASPHPQQATTKHTQTDAHKQRHSKHKREQNTKDPQKKHRPGTVSKTPHRRAQTGPTARQPHPNPDADQDTQTPGLHERPPTHQCTTQKKHTNQDTTRRQSKDKDPTVNKTEHRSKRTCH